VQGPRGEGGRGFEVLLSAASANMGKRKREDGKEGNASDAEEVELESDAKRPKLSGDPEVAGAKLS